MSGSSARWGFVWVFGGCCCCCRCRCCSEEKRGMTNGGVSLRKVGWIFCWPRAEARQDKARQESQFGVSVEKEKYLEQVVVRNKCF